jgi:hypothetical protein
MPTGQPDTFAKRTSSDGRTSHSTAEGVRRLRWQRLDGRHRVNARVEDHFKEGNTTGAKRLPSKKSAVNAAWCRNLNFPPDWPWTAHIQAIFARPFAIPALG